MKETTEKFLAIKRRILAHIKVREYTQAFDLFHNYFSQENPPDPNFIKNIYIELNKLDQFELGFKFVEELTPWYPEEVEIQQLRSSALKIYCDSLLVLGNRLLTEREEKANIFHESLKRTDSLTKDKVKEENEKILLNLTNKALESFRKAYEINSDSLNAINGLYRCYKLLNDFENISRFQAILEEKNPQIAIQKDQKVSKEKSIFTEEPEIEESSLNEIKALFDTNKHEEVIQRVDFLHLIYKISVPLLLLKARSLAALKRFKEADKIILEAEKTNLCIKEIQELKNSLNEVKYNLLNQAAEIYLKKAIELGPTLGEPYFKKAKICLQKALEIFPDNIDLLDQQYTVCRYLKEDEEAFKIRAMIYLLNNKFIPTFDRKKTNTLCFIATYAYCGSIEKIEVFRWFRREYLLPFAIGRTLNCYYVKYGGKLTEIMKQLKISPALLRIILYPMFILIRFLKRRKDSRQKL